MRGIADRFERFLRSRNLRLTKQRAAIVAAIYATHRHVTADELFEMLQRRPHTARMRISRATVYRTLSLLTEGGFVQALDLGRDTGTLYEHTLGHKHHDHMICLDCGKIIEFENPQIEALQESVAERFGFRLSSHKMELYGTCRDCTSD